MKPETIEKAKKEWLEINDYYEEVMKYFKGGLCFQFKPDEIIKDKSNSHGFVNAYLGLLKGKLNTFLIDEEVLRYEEYYIAECFPPDVNMFDELAHAKVDDSGSKTTYNYRVHLWNFNTEYFVKTIIRSHGMAEYFKIPKKHLIDVSAEVTAFFAVNNDGKYSSKLEKEMNYEPPLQDLILLKGTDNSEPKPESNIKILSSSDDTVLSCPPF